MEENKRLIHIGAGGDYREGFINSDKTLVWKGNKRKLDDVFDLGEPWPYENESVDGIVSMHALQQLTGRELFLNAFPEAYRVLKKGGVMRFGVPMVEISDKPIEYLLGWNNITLLSRDLLENVSKRVGFSKFRERGYRRSYLPELAKVDNRHKRGTLYFDVVK